MVQTIELLPDAAEKPRPLFPNPEDYARFREAFMEEVIPQQEKWTEARRRSEEKARQRLLR